MAITMRKVWLQTSNNRYSHTQFTKVYPIEKIRINKDTEVVVHCDSNYQIINIEGHPELNFLKGRPFLLEVDLIRERCLESLTEQVA